MGPAGIITSLSLTALAAVGTSQLSGCDAAQTTAPRAARWQPNILAPASLERAIIGGTPATTEAFPTVVGLVVDGFIPLVQDGELLTCLHAPRVCTGTVIREDVVLTAAHCAVNPEGPEGIEPCPDSPLPPAYTFEADLVAAAKGERLVSTRAVVVHPDFIRDKSCSEPPGVGRWNDIALVFLNAPVEGARLQRNASPRPVWRVLTFRARVAQVRGAPAGSPGNRT